MKTHFDYLQISVPDLSSRRVLDLGSGTGDFLIDAASRGVVVEGLEYNRLYINETNRKFENKKIKIKVTEGQGEKLPFCHDSFDFVNICEVIEHVDDPEKMLREVYRILSPGGLAYLSVPNRFGFKDQHFHLHFVNWVPRRWSNQFISLFGKHKKYDTSAGRQRLEEMHYYTYKEITKLLFQIGFSYVDLRKQKLEKKGLLPVFSPLYWFIKNFILDSFHFVIKKP